MSEMIATAKDSSDDFLEHDGPQGHPDMSSHDTVNPDVIIVPTSDDENKNDTSHTTNSGKSGVMQGTDGYCGHGGHDGGSLARNDDIAGTSSQGRGSSARSDCNPSTSCADEDYSSYLTLMATLPDDSTDDEDLNLALIASLESQI